MIVPSTRTHAATGANPYVSFRKQTADGDFAGSALAGVQIDSRNGAADIHLVPNALQTGRNPKLYGAQSYSYGTLESPAFDSAQPFDRAIASWNALTPAGTWIQVELRAFRPSDNHWTKYYNMGVWTAATTTLRRRSVNGQGDGDGSVASDTLTLSGGAAYTRYQYRLTLFTRNLRASPSVRLVSVMTSDNSLQPGGLALASDQKAWGVELPVPQRSQMLYKGGGEAWCSPTSTSMVLAYWGINVPVPTAASGTYDSVYGGNGNWPFNTAWAATYGLEAYVTRLGSMTQVEEWIKAGVPVIMSYGFRGGALPGAPYSATSGHIMVIRGFDAAGNVIVNDPAARSNSAVRIIYDRTKLESLWLAHSGGTVYLMYPRGHRIPAENALGSW
jgi:hypothetical protein